MDVEQISKNLIFQELLSTSWWKTVKQTPIVPHVWEPKTQKEAIPDEIRDIRRKFPKKKTCHLWMENYMLLSRRWFQWSLFSPWPGKMIQFGIDLTNMFHLGGFYHLAMERRRNEMECLMFHAYEFGWMMATSHKGAYAVSGSQKGDSWNLEHPTKFKTYWEIQILEKNTTTSTTTSTTTTTG